MLKMLRLVNDKCRGTDKSDSLITLKVNNNDSGFIVR